VALPPDIPGKQQLYYGTLSPLPERIYSDADGNVLAVYKVNGNSGLEISLTGSVKISGEQINPEFGGKIGEIPNNLTRRYTKADDYWESDAPAIQDIARELFDLDLTTSQNAQKVYEYVTTTLVYDFDIVQKDFIDRKGALTAATTPGPWACMEFTDLFIAVTRAMGIPARELNGYAFTRESNLTPLSISLKSGDLLHSWAEFYDPNFGWVQVDPTWGTTSSIDYFTKLDTNHFVFSIKGTDSEYPFPAGTYKVKGNEKQVEVDIAQSVSDEAFTNHLKVYRKGNFNPIKILQNQEKYLVYNEKGQKLFNINNSGTDLLPFSGATIFLPKENTEFYYEDFNGEGKMQTFTIESGEPPKLGISSTPLIVLVFVALLLCGTIYYFAIHPTALQTLLARLRRHPQGQDQSPNQNSQ
jgi:transglutaminase-like putative cysteine protease